MRSIALVTLLVLAVLAPSAPAHAKTAKKATKKAAADTKTSPEKVRQEFDQFCQEWMGKLAKREHDNIQNIKWNTDGNGVAGEYVGYLPDHTCVVKPEYTEPVGEILYQEVRYEKRGASISEAEHSQARAIESTAVTEIFRYDHGKWIY